MAARSRARLRDEVELAARIDDAQCLLGPRIRRTHASLRDAGTGIEATFAKGLPRTFDFVLGCDGLHSSVRRLWFGDEARFVHFLEQYFSITIIDELLIERDTVQLFNVPGKAIMLNAYKNEAQSGRN